MTTSAASNSAMSLLQKFQDINDRINQTRTERASVLGEIQRIQQEIASTKQERCQSEQQILTAEQETALFQNKIEEAYKENSQVEEEYSKAFLAKEMAQQQKANLQQCIVEHRQAFLEESREFRAHCKRLRLRASVLGLDFAPMGAFALAKGMDVGVYEDVDEASMAVDSNDFSDDPEQWTIAADDEEMKERFDSYVQRKAEYDAAQKELDDLKARKQAASNKADRRQEGKDQLQTQLSRIHKDNVDLQSQIDELNRLADEAQQLGESFAYNVQRRKNSVASVTPSPFPRTNARQESGVVTGNPYARSNKSTSSTTNNNAYSSNLASMPADRRAELREVALGRSTRRGRGTRRDRQFGSSLQIGGDFMDDEEEENEEMPTSTFSNPLLQELEKEDDEEDEALLSYVAFAKKK